jgi:septum formation protein
MTGPRVVLASSSPRRSILLHQLGLVHEVDPARVDESHAAGEGWPEYVERLAREKAEAVVPRHPGALIVAGDTVVVRDDQILGKPAGREEAVGMLLSLAGRTHTVLSGVAVAGAHGTVSSVGRAEVRFRSFGRADAEAYVATGEPMDKAGAYGIQGLGASLVEGMEGDYYSVVGLPLGRLLELFEATGWQYAFGRLEARGGPGSSNREGP